MKKYAFLINDLGRSQETVLLASNINKQIEEKGYSNIAVFVLDNIVPCMHPKFAYFSAYEHMYYDHPIVVTNLKMMEYVHQTKPKMVWYVQDVVLDYPHDRLLPHMFKDTGKLKNILKIARCKDHYDYMIGQGWQNVSPIIVKDYDLAAMDEAIIAAFDNIKECVTNG